MDQPINTRPSGLGWTARLGGPNRTLGLPPTEACSVILCFGLLAVSVSRSI